MYTFPFLKLILVHFLLSRANAESGTKDFLQKFNTYNEVCRGMGFKGDNCKGRDRDIISFHARKASNLQNLGNNAVVIFGTVNENSGSAYNGKTGTFTAPQDGIYSFTWTILTKHGKIFVTNIVLNDTKNEFGYNYVDGRSGSQTHSTGSTTAIINMMKNDKVWIKKELKRWRIRLCFQFLKLNLVSFLLTGANADSDTKDFLRKFNTCNEVCRGMGFKGDNCEGRERAIISFHARMANDQQNLGNNAVVVFGKVTENSGSAYNGNTGKFMAPRDGIYSFTWTILTKPGKVFVTNIVLNDTRNVIGYNSVDGKTGSQNYPSGSATTIIKMKKNNKVWIKTHGKAGEFAYAHWSSFSGFRLS